MLQPEREVSKDYNSQNEEPARLTLGRQVFLDSEKPGLHRTNPLSWKELACRLGLARSMFEGRSVRHWAGYCGRSPQVLEAFQPHPPSGSPPSRPVGWGHPLSRESQAPTAQHPVNDIDWPCQNRSLSLLQHSLESSRTIWMLRLVVSEFTRTQSLGAQWVPSPSLFFAFKR